MLANGKAAAAVLVILLGWVYRTIQPPPAKICGSPDGPPVTSPRIRLADGRFLAFKEAGTPKEKAQHKIISVHGFDATKDFDIPASQNLVDELGIYFLSFDRAGYGESDPNPKRTVASDAMDIGELADAMGIGKFYLIGVSMGAYPVWSCLNYIPHRLEGVALVVPAVNYWWPSVPPEVTRRAYGRLPVQYRRMIWIAHHAPSLLHGWMTQKWFPTLSAAHLNPDTLTEQDLEILQKVIAHSQSIGFQNKARQQGAFESIHRDLMVVFSNWEFDPLNMSNPFPHNGGSVHIWQGYHDKVVQVELQRYVAQKLPWIHYHENPEGGHFFMYKDNWTDTILKALLIQQDHTTAA